MQKWTREAYHVHKKMLPPHNDPSELFVGDNWSELFAKIVSKSDLNQEKSVIIGTMFKNHCMSNRFALGDAGEGSPPPAPAGRRLREKQPFDSTTVTIEEIPETGNRKKKTEAASSADMAPMDVDGGEEAEELSCRQKRPGRVLIVLENKAFRSAGQLKTVKTR